MNDTKFKDTNPENCKPKHIKGVNPKSAKILHKNSITPKSVSEAVKMAEPEVSEDTEYKNEASYMKSNLGIR